eukprot:TRINITY_DN1853_c0_g1_i6.p1 TRINITY_DN1853_c0_g1~~TRINITY_DN1853_c0_g1_i6.p1  ORF type:complete len:176 (+),score=21.62 TRINITY_DN1853_c0_g1_i6:82-609(+)
MDYRSSCIGSESSHYIPSLTPWKTSSRCSSESASFFPGSVATGRLVGTVSRRVNSGLRESSVQGELKMEMESLGMEDEDDEEDLLHHVLRLLMETETVAEREKSSQDCDVDIRVQGWSGLDVFGGNSALYDFEEPGAKLFEGLSEAGQVMLSRLGDGMSLPALLSSKPGKGGKQD